MNLSEFRKNKYGDQKAQNTTFLGAVSGKSGDELQAAQEQAKTAAETRKKATALPTFTERVSKTATGAVKGSGAGFVNTGGMALRGASALNDMASQDRQKIQAAQDNIKRYEAQLSAAKTEAERQRLRMLIQRNRNAAGLSQENMDDQTRYTDKGAEYLEQTADRLAESSAQDIQRAKKGAGKLGQFAVDVGVAGAQMGGDVLLGLLTGGSALPAMTVRGFGGAAQEARQSGASVGQQAAYGAMSAGVSLATEKLSNIAAPFKKAFGAGVLDETMERLAGKLGQNAVVKTALSAAGEGIEEVLEDVAQPILQRITYDPEALVHYKDPEYWANALYDGLVGGALGGLGGAAEGIGNRMQRTGRKGAVETAGTAGTGAEGNVTPQAQKPTQGVSGDVMTQEAQRLFGQQKAAPEVEAANTRLADSDVDTYLRVGERKHVRDLKQGMQRTGDSPVLSSPSKIRSFIQDSIVGKIRDTIKAYGKVGTRFQSDVSTKSGGKTDFAGYYLELDSNRMQHLSEHIQDDGDVRNIPLTEEQVLSIPDYIDSYDDVLDVVTKKDGQTRIYLGKQINGHSVIVVLASKGRSSIQPVTAWQNTTEHYLKKYGLNKKMQVDTSQDPAVSSGNESGYKPASFKDSIPQADQKVNSGDIPVDSSEGRQTFPHLNRMFDEAGVKGHSDAGADGLGAADAGFTTQGMEGREQTSRFAESMPYDRSQEAATGLSREDYGKIFRYQSQTEAKSLHLAEELLYFQQGGQRRFLLDIDPTAFSELLQSLDDATAWNGPQMDAARMILDELKGRSVNMEIESEVYTNFLKSMREHETSTGQGVQANAKWSRQDNSQGQATELDALENLEKSGLPKEEQQRLFRRILQWDMEVQNAQDGDTAALKRIIMEVAQERGVLSGVLTKRQSGMMTKVADSALNSLTFDQLRQFAYSSTAALSTDSSPANIGQKIKTIQVLNMLSNPKTAAKNLTGNTSFYVLDAAAMRGAAILDMAVSKLTGTRSVAMERFALGKSSLRDAARAAQMAIAEITLDVDMGGEQTRYGTGSKRTFKASGNIVERALSAIERNQGYLLNATDEFYKGAARGTQAATQKLVDSGKIKTENADYAAQQADQLAKYRTFQDNSKVSAGIQTIHDVLNMIGVGDSGRTVGGQTVHSFGAGDIVAPFTKVAGNLVSRGLEYSPVNAVKGTVEIVEQVAMAAGGKTVDPAVQAKGVSNLARGMTGTAIAYGFMLLAASGLLRQAEDEDDPDVAALNQSEGVSGSQVNISAAQRALNGGTAQWQAGDTLVDLSSIEPLNLLLNLGTEMAKENENPIVTAWNATGKSFFDASAELPVVQGMGNFAKDVMVYKKDPLESLLEEGTKTAVSSVTPNILRAAAKGLDDRPRNVYTGDSLWELVRDSFRNSVPRLREELPGSVNTLGEEKTYQGSRTDNLLNAMLNPIGVNTYLQSNVSREMERVRQATGSTSFYPSKSIPSKLSYTKDGETVERALTYEQRQAYQKVRGQTINQTMASVMKTSAYQNAGNHEKAALLDRCHNYANAIARESVLGSDSVDAWVHHARDAQSEIGKSTAEYLTLYEQYGGDIMSGKAYDTTQEALDAGLTIGEYAAYKDSVKGLSADKDANGVSISGTKKAKVIAAIAAQDLSATEKDWLYLLNYDGKNAQKDLRKMPWNQ